VHVEMMSPRPDQFAVDNELGVKAQKVDIFAQRRRRPVTRRRFVRPAAVMSAPAASTGLTSRAMIAVLVFAFVAVAGVAALVTALVIQGELDVIVVTAVITVLVIQGELDIVHSLCTLHRMTVSSATSSFRRKSP